MITISNHLQLENITIDLQKDLMALMLEIYPPAYKHLWINEDSDWYLTHCFSQENLKLELNETNAFYGFVISNSKRVGIIRFLVNTSVNNSYEKNATFIHRIYLSQEAQGKGIAKQLFYWIEQRANENKNKVLWLKAMDTKIQALKFYEKQGFKIVDTFSLDFNIMHPHLRGMVVMTKTLLK